MWANNMGGPRGQKSVCGPRPTRFWRPRRDINACNCTM